MYKDYSFGEKPTDFLIALVVLAFGLLLVMMYYYMVCIPLAREIREIKNEIKTSSGRERAYWKKELKKLYLSYIPIIGKYL